MTLKGIYNRAPVINPGKYLCKRIDVSTCSIPFIPTRNIAERAIIGSSLCQIKTMNTNVKNRIFISRICELEILNPKDETIALKFFAKPPGKTNSSKT